MSLVGSSGLAALAAASDAKKHSAAAPNARITELLCGKLPWWDRRCYSACMSETVRRKDDAGITPGDDPFALFDGWMEAAKRTEPDDATAMALATADASGRANVR